MIFYSFFFFFVVLHNNGGIICFGEGINGVNGNDNSGNLGTGVTLISDLDFIVFSDSFRAQQISLSKQTVCGVFSNARVRCWGLNTHQQLGDCSAVNKGWTTSPGSITDTTFVNFSPTITDGVVAVDAGS